MAIGAIQASQCWAVLARHAQEDIANLRLQELCRDNDRVSALVSVYNTTFEMSSHKQPSSSSSLPEGAAAVQESRLLIADLSRQRWTLETVNLLLGLASAKNLRKFVRHLAWGQNNPLDPVVPKVTIEEQLKGQQEEGVDSNNYDNGHEPNGGGGVPTNLDAKKFTRFQSESTRPKPTMVDTTGVGGLGHHHQQQHHHPHQQQQEMTSCPSMHMALRVPKKKDEYAMYLRDGSDALGPIHSTWERIERFAGAIRLGQIRSVTGGMFRNLIVVGRGVPVEALKFIDRALQQDERAVLASRAGVVEATTTRLRRMATNQHIANAGRRIRFLTSIDPLAASQVIHDLDPATTLVISWALNGNEETGLATKLLKSWLLQELGNNRRSDVVLSKHMLLVTGNDHVASVINKPESVFLVPEHTRCEAFTSTTAATLLPLSIVYGWPIVKDFLKGAHDMDSHFVDTNPRHNLPILLALSDVWNDIFLNTSARAIVPFTEAFGSYPAFCAALEAQTCGNTTTKSTGRPNASKNPTCSAFVMDGGLNSVYDRAFFQSTKVMNEELVTALDSQISFHLQKTLGVAEDVQMTQDALMASFFAHADELAFGYDRILSDPVLPSPMSTSVQTALPEPELSRGNRPSTLLICGKLDAFACGQLIALAEHRVAVKAHLWGIDPFCTDFGASLRMQRTDHVKDDLETLLTNVNEQDSDDDESGGGVQNHNMNLSTRTILKHYARMMIDKRSRGSAHAGTASA